MLPPFDIPDAEPLGGAGRVPSAELGAAGRRSGSTPPPHRCRRLAAPAPAPSPAASAAASCPAIFRAADLTPVVLLLSLLTAAALGAGHALTPGHGKTLMAAYLVGTRGTPLHALGLGLSVTLSHTLGILVLAALVVGAAGRPAAGHRRSLGARRGGHLDRGDRRLDAGRRAPASSATARRRRRPRTSTATRARA